MLIPWGWECKATTPNIRHIYLRAVVMRLTVMVYDCDMKPPESLKPLCLYVCSFAINASFIHHQVYWKHRQLVTGRGCQISTAQSGNPICGAPQL